MQMFNNHKFLISLVTSFILCVLLGLGTYADTIEDSTNFNAIDETPSENVDIVDNSEPNRSVVSEVLENINSEDSLSLGEEIADLSTTNGSSDEISDNERNLVDESETSDLLNNDELLTMDKSVVNSDFIESEHSDSDVHDRNSNDNKQEPRGFYIAADGSIRYRDLDSGEDLKSAILEEQFGSKRMKIVFDEMGKVSSNSFVKLDDGRLVFAKNDGALLETEGLVDIEGSTYVFKSDNSVLLDDWYKTENGSLVYSAPNTGEIYKRGGFTLNDGIRYVFDDDGLLAKGKWVNEPGYGRYYGDPSTGAAYINGGFTVSDGIRYVFDKYGLLAKDKWVDEPGYGRYYGDPSTGAAYINGGFTVSDGIRYVFDKYGLLAKGKWVDEPGYGRYYGNPNTGAAYTQGAFTTHDGYRYVFDDYGLLAKNKWVFEPGYGFALGEAETGRAYRAGAYSVVRNGISGIYVFNEYAYLSQKEAWIFNKDYGWTFSRSDGTAYRNTLKKINGQIYLFGNDGYLANDMTRNQRSNTRSSRTSKLPVNVIYQHPQLPNGCEVTSLAIALGAAGYTIDKVDLYNNYLNKAELINIDGKRYGASPEHSFIGDARGAGWYCFEEPIIRAGNQLIE